MWNVPLLISLLIVSIVYVYTLKQFVKTFNKQPILFFVGLIVLYFTLGTPLAAFSHLSFSSHMLQMSVLYFIIPPLILFGIPNILYHRMLDISVFKLIRRLFLPPIVSLIIFAGLLFLYHLPTTLHIFSLNPRFHEIYLVLLFFLSLRMWWPFVLSDQSKEEKKKNDMH
ncbi:cytochrome c oxidase assembly protein [Allobacillus sp. GCM10007490]